MDSSKIDQEGAASGGAETHLLGGLPETLLGSLSTAATTASPQRVASNIRGFFANRIGNAIPDTGKHYLFFCNNILIDIRI